MPSYLNHSTFVFDHSTINLDQNTALSDHSTIVLDYRIILLDHQTIVSILTTWSTKLDIGVSVPITMSAVLKKAR